MPALEDLELMILNDHFWMGLTSESKNEIAMAMARSFYPLLRGVKRWVMEFNPDDRDAFRERSTQEHARVYDTLEYCDGMLKRGVAQLLGDDGQDDGRKVGCTDGERCCGRMRKGLMGCIFGTDSLGRIARY